MSVMPDRDRIRVVYFGTPTFAVPALRALSADERFDVVLVVTQPDRPAGRGRKLVMPAVKDAALELGPAVYQPERLRSGVARQPLIDSDADVFVVAAYGVIFGPKALAIPRFGCLNLHASLLPAYRGANPINAAIAGRESSTGVTLMRMETGLDTGPMLGASAIDITDVDTTDSLTARLALVGADLATSLIPAWVAGEIAATPQPLGATLTRPMTKADGWLDWSRPAIDLEAQVRAMWPWPRAWTTVLGGDDGAPHVLQVHQAALSGQDEPDTKLPPGTVLAISEGLVVATGLGLLELGTVQEPGGRPIAGSVLLASGRLRQGTVLGSSGAPASLSPLVRPVED